MFTSLKSFNQKGQILFIMPFVMIFISFAMGLSLLYVSVSEQMKKQDSCWKFGIRLQSIYAELAEKIEALNPKAKSLQLQVAIAYKAWLLAPDPKTKAIAYSRYKWLRYQQNLLGFQQKGLFKAYEAKAKIYIFRFSPQKHYFVHNLPTKLHFVANRKNSPAPVYLRASNFLSKQALKLSWRKNLNSQDSIQGSCLVNLVKEGEWFGKIIKGKALSKRFSH